MAESVFPRWLGRELLVALGDAIGTYNLDSLVRMARITIPTQDGPLTRDVSGTDIRRLTVALIDLYGEKDGVRLMRRAGQQVFRNPLRTWRAASLLRLACWLLPASNALDLALRILSGLWREHTNERVILEPIPHGYRWQLEPCGFCDPPSAKAWMQGILEGFLLMCDISHATVSCIECSDNERKGLFEITLSPDSPTSLRANR